MTVLERRLLPVVFLGIAGFLALVEWHTKTAKAQPSAGKCGIYQEQEAHLGNVKFVRVRDTCAHLICMQVISEMCCNNPLAISCTKE